LTNKGSTKWLDKLMSLGPVQTGLDWVKTHSLPGFGGVPIYDVALFIYREAQEDDITTRANSMAFSFFLALFPAVIFLFTLTAYLPIADNFLPTLKNYFEQIMPTKAGEYLFNMIVDIVAIQRSGLLSVGFLTALLFASNGMIAMMRGFDKSYPQSFRNRKMIEKRWVAIKLTFLLVVMMLVSIALVVLWSVILRWLSELFEVDFLNSLAFSLIQYLIVGLTLYTAISIIYRVGPAFYEKLSWFSPGTTLATSLSLMSSMGFSYFVNNYGAYNQLYGAIGALSVILLWIQINCFIILVGFALNASIRVNRDIRTQSGEGVRT